MLTVALLPGVLQNPPHRWKRLIGQNPTHQDIEHMLRLELKDAFGQSDDVFGDMSVKAIFKGVTYELLSDTEFMRVASLKIPKLETHHDEFDAAKAEKKRDHHP